MADADVSEGGDRIAPVTYLFGAAGDAPAAPVRSSELSRAFVLDDRSGSWADDPEGNDVDDDDVVDDYLGMEQPRPDDGLRDEARDQALRALGRKGLSQREVERLLTKNLVPDDIAREVVEGLRRDGYIDDTALAQELVGRLQERKGLGRSAVAAELTRRLFAPSAISYALELVDSGDELARAREVAAKRAGQLRSLDRETAVRRLSGYLQRRGYSGSAVRSAVDSALPPTGTGVRFE